MENSCYKFFPYVLRTKNHYGGTCFVHIVLWYTKQTQFFIKACIYKTWEGSQDVRALLMFLCSVRIMAGKQISADILIQINCLARKV
jgi:hypothetical protein